MEIGPPISVQRLAAPHSRTRSEFLRGGVSGTQFVRWIIGTAPVEEKHDAVDRRTAEHPGTWPGKAMS